jgi:transcriptional regulator of acetoin/glycerol metabolism
MNLLLDYDWKGNVRELENVIEYAFVRTSKSEIIEANKLPTNLFTNKTTPQIPFSHSKEKTDLLILLEKYQWNRSKVAEVLGVGRTTLWRKLKKLQIIED